MNIVTLEHCTNVEEVLNHALFAPFALLHDKDFVFVGGNPKQP